jgi:ribosomal protein L7Ae-like RNA K-turn-binding protein
VKYYCDLCGIESDSKIVEVETELGEVPGIPGKASIVRIVCYHFMKEKVNDRGESI